VLSHLLYIYNLYEYNFTPVGCLWWYLKTDQLIGQKVVVKNYNYIYYHTLKKLWNGLFTNIQDENHKTVLIVITAQMCAYF